MNLALTPFWGTESLLDMQQARRLKHIFPGMYWANLRKGFLFFVFTPNPGEMIQFD